MIKEKRPNPKEQLAKATEIFHNEMAEILLCPNCHKDGLIPLDILSVDRSGVFAKYDCKSCDKIVSEGLGDLFKEFEQLGDELKGLLKDLYCAELKINGETIDMVVIQKDDLQEAVDVFLRLGYLPTEKQYVIMLTKMNLIFEGD